MIGCLVAVGLLILCIKGQADKAKKQRQAAAARAAQSQSHPTPVAPVPPPEPQPAPPEPAAPDTELTAAVSSRQEPADEPEASAMATKHQESSTPETKRPPPFFYDIQPNYPANPQDEPPPYPGASSVPPAAYPASGYPTQPYPATSWTYPAYPSDYNTSVPYLVNDSTLYPSNPSS